MLLESNPQPSEQAILEALESILSSPELKAENLRAFLRYVVEQSLQGRGDQIKEYTIGIDVFHRGESFDPRRDNIVRLQARRLRWALSKYYQGEGSEDPVRIEFPMGAYRPAFRFSAAPASAEALAIHAVEGPREEDASVLAPSKFRWKVPVLLALVCLIALAAYLKFGWRRGVNPAAKTPSIAVLPFRSLNAEKEEEFFSDGLTEDLTDSLAQMPGIRVMAPSSAFQYKGKVLDIRRVGRELNVGAVLEGSVRRSDGRLRITAQLSDAASGYHLWAASYDRDAKEVLTVQREISSAISKALGVTLAGSKPGITERPDDVPSEAYEDYLKGRYFLAKDTLKDFETAIGYFQQAIAKDSSYAPSYAGLAHCYARIPLFTSTVSSDVVAKIRENASKALALDPKLGEAHVDLAVAYNYDYEWAMAEQEFRKALDLSPGVAVVHQRYGTFLMKMGRLPEAVVEFQKARSLDPVSASTNTSVARPLYFTHRYDEALAQYAKSLELNPNSATIHEYIGMAYVMKGMHDKGIREINFAHQLVKDNVWYTGLLGYAEAVDGRSADAHEILNSLLKQATHAPSPALAIAQIHIGLGDKNQAFEWLRKAIDEHNPNVSLKGDPLYDSLRGDPRFADLLRRMNLS